MVGILGAFQVGISGLAAAGGGLAVVGDNIANSGTAGFKSSRAEFQDVLATSLKGIDGGDQFGAGTKLAHIKPQFTQGNIARTENITDLAISGNGFFQIEAPFGYAYSRDGSFHFDKDGVLINADGYVVRGFQVGENGQINNKVAPVKLGQTTIAAKATEKVNINMNLDSREDVKVFNVEKPEETSSYSTTLSIYDNIGTARLITMYYNKAENNTWEYHAVVDGKDAAGGEEGKYYEMASGRLVFNDKGILQEEVEQLNELNFNKGAAPGQKVTFNYGESITEGGTGIDAATQYGSESAVSRHTQDGATAATLTSLSFNDKGTLTAAYNNGESRDLAQIAIAKFENNEGLFKVGKNLFKESSKSGQAAMGRPHEAGRGEILSKSIELSNVDLATEFISLMEQQRNFQANAKTINTADQMLQEVLNIKRG